MKKISLDQLNNLCKLCNALEMCCAADVDYILLEEYICQALDLLEDELTIGTFKSSVNEIENIKNVLEEYMEGLYYNRINDFDFDIKYWEKNTIPIRRLQYILQNDLINSLE